MKTKLMTKVKFDKMSDKAQKLYLNKFADKVVDITQDIRIFMDHINELDSNFGAEVMQTLKNEVIR